MEFCPPDDYPVVPALYYMNILVRIGLVSRTLGSITLWIGHCPYNHQVFVLNIDQPFLESFKIVGAVFFIYFIGNGIGGIDTVMAHASLKTGCGLLTEHTKEFNFFDQVFNVLMHVGKTADSPAGKVRGGYGQVFILLVTFAKA